jgi:UDP-3-O-[3-hydroxymyristoyl] N-acetylglucosamine deacetylase
MPLTRAGNATLTMVRAGQNATRSFEGETLLNQRTVARTIRHTGIGLHSGRAVYLEIQPAAANSGLRFVRTDLHPHVEIPAHPSSVFDTTLATRLGSPEVYVSTVEHLMAALFGLGVDNARICVNSSELPIVDGSAAPWLILLDEAGIEDLGVPRPIRVVKKPIEVVDPRNPSRFIRVEPSKEPRITYSIDFSNNALIGAQSLSIPLTGRSFCEALSHARTFCTAEEVEFLRSRGLALGGTLENAIVVSRTEGLLNAGGLRAPDEFVRHKILDCIGDLALLGTPISGHIIAHKAGHDLHTALASKLAESSDAVEIKTSSSPSASSKERSRNRLLDFPTSLGELPAFARLNLVSG